MKKKICAALTAGALAGFAGPSAANDLFDYTYGQAGLALYPSADIHGIPSQDYFGIDLKGSYELTPDIFAFGGFKFLTDDIDLTSLHVGGAYRVNVDERIDLYGGPSLEYQRVSNGGSDDDIGLGLRGGLRLMLNPEVELGGEIRIVTGDADYVGLTGTAQYYLDSNLSVVGELDIYDGEFGLIGGVRMMF